MSVYLNNCNFLISHSFCYDKLHIQKTSNMSLLRKYIPFLFFGYNSGEERIWELVKPAMQFIHTNNVLRNFTLGTQTFYAKYIEAGLYKFFIRNKVYRYLF